MKLYFMPKTRLGKWSAGFGAVFFAFFLLSPILMALNQQPAGEKIMTNPVVRPLLIAIGLTAMASGLLAFFTGIISLIKDKERSVLIYITVFIGLFAVAFLLGEFLFPH